MTKKVISRAPLRLGMSGGGSDVPSYSDSHGGSVLNVSINQYAYASLTLTDDNVIKFHASDLDIKFNSIGASILEIDSNLPLHKAVYNRIVKDFNKGVTFGV
ncbi:MAG: hypothetical protein P8H03_04190, partial [Emcibacteraceae bacterium]|nr:hypothetical protein [Emcibacteraceae bacterium]